MEQINPLPNPSVPPETPINPPINPSSSNKPLLIIFLIVFVIVLVSINAYLFLKLQNQPKTPVASPAPVVQTTPTPTPDPTANWKTYTEDFFSLQYPADWAMTNTTLANNSIEIKGSLGEKLNLTVHKGIGPGIGIEMCEIGDKETVKEEKIFVDKSVAVKIYFQCSKTNQRSIVVTASKRIPMLTLEYWYQSNNSNTSDKILDQILSTFKFLQ